MDCFILIHQGYADLFNSIGLINYFSEKYKNIFVFVQDISRKNILDEIFYNKNEVKILIPNFVDFGKSNQPNTCLNCMVDGNYICPRDTSKKCIYINFNEYNGDIIKIGSFNNFSKWIDFLKQQKSFAHAFYTYQGINEEIRLNKFLLYNDENKINDSYNKFIEKYGSDYVLIHEDNERNFNINRNKIINNNLPIINLNLITNIFVDYLLILKNSKEIHLIDSSWSVLIYLLSKDYLKNIPIYLNESLSKSLGRDTGIYKNKTFDNWIFY